MGHNNENALFCGVKCVVTAFLINIHSRILERLERQEIPWNPPEEVLYFDIDILDIERFCRSRSFFYESLTSYTLLKT